MSFNRLFVIYCCILLLTGITSWGHAQYRTPVHFTPQNGLTTESMFSCAEDKEGFIWLASETGASQFNGKDFVHYKAHEGITHSLINFYIDDNNQILARTISNNLLYFKGGKWVEPDSSLNSVFRNKEHRVNQIKHFDNITLVHYDNHVLFLHFDEAGKLRQQTEQHVFADLFATIIHAERKGRNVHLYTATEKVSLPVDWEIEGSEEKRERTSYVYAHQRVYCIKAGQLSPVQLPDSLNITTVLFHENTLYVACKEGLWRYKRKNDTVFVSDKTPLLEIPCVDLLIDQRKNLWVCSQLDGVYLFPYQLGKSVIDWPLKGDFLLKVRERQGHYKALSSLGKIVRFQNDSFHIEKDLKTLAYDFQVHNNNEYYLTTDELWKNDSVVYEDRGWFKSMLIDEEKAEWFIGRGDGLVKIHPETMFIGPEMVNRIYALHTYNDDVLMGTEQGIFRYAKSKVSPFSMRKLTELEYIVAIEQNTDSCLFFLARNRGVVLKHRDEELLIKEHTDLLSEPTCIFPLQKGVVLVGTRKGLNVVHYSVNPLQVDDIKTYTSTNGLAFDKINSINFNQNKRELIVTYNHAFQVIPREQLLTRAKESRLYYHYIGAENTRYHTFEDVIFAPKERDIEISFAALDYAAESSHGYTYRLIEVSKEWSHTSAHLVRFSDLSPGAYTFELKYPASYTDSEPLQLHFSLLPAFWQTWWFRLMVMVLLLIGIYLCIRWYLHKTKKQLQEKADIQTTIANLELEAQKSLLKPHFIFNCLNAIQYYIKKNEAKKADTYLVEFSKLIRQSLDLSGNDQTTVQQELAFTKRYIEMEHRRFGELFDYSIQVDQTLLAEPLPSLLLQTFVENAINHGLRYKEEGKGHLKLEVKQLEQDHFEIVIADNGIGREKAKLYQKKGHVSKGIAIIQQRIEAYQQKYKTSVVLKITDNHEGHKEKGVKVVIRVAKMQSNQLQ